MNGELRQTLSEVASCLNGAEEEKSAYTLLLALKNYPSVNDWKEELSALIDLKKQISKTPVTNRKIVHSLLEQALMVCIDRGLSGEVNINDLRRILDFSPDDATLITAQEALEYRLGQLALMAMRMMNQNQQWESALFFLEQAVKRHTPLNPEDYLAMSETYRNNQRPDEAVSCYKRALMQV